MLIMFYNYDSSVHNVSWDLDFNEALIWLSLLYNGQVLLKTNQLKPFVLVLKHGQVSALECRVCL